MQDDLSQESLALSIDDLVAKTTDLVPLPAVYFEVNRIVQDSDSSIIDLARTIAMDPALTARILRIVNSPLYAQSRPVETVSRAVNMLGMQQIHDLVLVNSLCSSFARVPLDAPELQTFWHDSVLRAVLASGLAKRLELGNMEKLFVLGLLSDLGLLVLWLHAPRLAGQASGLARQRVEPLHQAENELLGFDHAQLGGALLAAWKLPASIHEPIASQHQVGADQPFATEAAWLHVVGRIVEATERGLDPLIWVDESAWPLTQGATPDATVELLAESADEVAGIHSILFSNQHSR